MRRECQEAWSGIEPNFTERLTVDNKDITLDFRPMLAATEEELDASHSNYTLPRLAHAIVWQCPHLTRISVKNGTTRFLGQYHEDNDDEDYTTEEQWTVIEHILTLVEVIVEGANELTIIDLCFEPYNINTCFPYVVPCYGGCQYNESCNRVQPARSGIRKEDSGFLQEAVCSYS